jgi:hypothetical protein
MHALLLLLLLLIHSLLLLLKTRCGSATSRLV